MPHEPAMDDRIMEEVVLSRRAHPQPRPAIRSGGDCGPCSLGGLIGISPREVYDRIRRREVTQGIDRNDVIEVLHSADRDGLVDRIIDDVPVWPAYSGHLTWGHSGPMMKLEWSRWLRMAFDAGYYAITSVVHAGNGKVGDWTDHVVLLCGWRLHRVPLDHVKGAARLHDEVLVSCSSRHPDGQWYSTRDFLSQFGGYNVVLARPVEERCRP